MAEEIKDQAKPQPKSDPNDEYHYESLEQKRSDDYDADIDLAPE